MNGQPIIVFNRYFIKLSSLKSLKGFFFVTGLVLVGFKRKLGQSPLTSKQVIGLIAGIIHDRPVLDISPMPSQKLCSYAVWDIEVKVWFSYFWTDSRAYTIPGSSPAQKALQSLT